jgi:release factor glutamine methyltransferase
MPALDAGCAQRRHTIASALRELTAELRRAGIEDAGGDVRWLMADVLGASSADILREPERVIAPAQFDALRAFVERRQRHEPVSRILGRREFYGRTFAVSPATLDPRPDSETVITTALEIAREEGWHLSPLRILDVCTGTGCLLLTLLCELPHATGLGSDISEPALATACDNARRLDMMPRASWIRADALEGIAGPFHMLVGNPPYVRTGDIMHLEPEVRDFDPVLALDGGIDGLAVYRRLLGRAGAVVPKGWIVLEVGHDQADAVADLMASVPCVDAQGIRLRSDVSGRRRCVAARTLS